MAPLLALDGVRKRFGRVTVADGVSFTVGPADAVGVVGPNGAGKTSLFGIIAGDLAPDGGTVTFGGRDVTTVGAADRCRLGMGRTYQMPRPFEEMTVFENVLVAAQQGAGARGRAGFARAAEVLDATGLRADANRPAGELGLLQRKRLELARALATGPSLLLLDEVAAIIGANGAGKSTLLGAIAGVHRAAGGAVLLDGVDLGRATPERRVAAGISLVPEGRRLFGSLSVEENLLVGAHRARPGR